MGVRRGEVHVDVDGEVGGCIELLRQAGARLGPLVQGVDDHGEALPQRTHTRLGRESCNVLCNLSCCCLQFVLKAIRSHKT